MLKEEMKEYIEQIEMKSSQLEANNNTLTLYVKQLQTKLQEIGSVVTQYEKTILVMAGRLQEKDAFISEQNNEINRRND
jgi:sugar-specific transcriptional regulator TrmB